MNIIKLTIYLSEEEELDLLHQSLLDSLKLINQLENHQNYPEIIQQSMYWQIRLLQMVAMYKSDEK